MKVRYPQLNNFGDAANRQVVEWMTGEPVEQVWGHQDEALMAISSGLAMATSQHTVWGSGFMNWTDEPNRYPYNRPTILATRGPLSRDILLKFGVPSCPQVYGDPALLLPRIIKQKHEPKHEIGFIPHWREWSPPYLAWLKGENSAIKIINVCRPVEDVVADICSCERIATCSLHGLIVSHAYGVPARWVQLSGRLLGDNFKFADYFASQRIPAHLQSPVKITGDTTVTNMLRLQYATPEVPLDLSPLLRVFFEHFPQFTSHPL